MAPSEFRAVLLDHQRKALEGNILHINLSTSLKEVAAKGRRVAVDAHTGTRVGQRLCTCCLFACTCSVKPQRYVACEVGMG